VGCKDVKVSVLTFSYLTWYSQIQLYRYQRTEYVVSL